MDLRFLRPNKKRKPSCTTEQLEIACKLGHPGQLHPEKASDDEDSDVEPFRSGDLVVPAETYQDDADLVQEMEMDRHLWMKLPICKTTLLPLNILRHGKPTTGWKPSVQYPRHIGTSFGQNVQDLPRRWLQPGSVMDLYRQYHISVHEKQRASCFGYNYIVWAGEINSHFSLEPIFSRYSVFKDRYYAKWSGCLPFRSPSEFPECDLCHELKESIRQTRAPKLALMLRVVCICGYGPQASRACLHHEDLECKLQHIHQYREHLRDVARDRSVETTLQSENIFTDGVSRPILFLQTDGMDQAKWSVPRYGPPQQSKQASMVVRFLACRSLSSFFRAIGPMNSTSSR